MVSWGLRTKIVLSVGAIVFVALGTSTLVQTRFLQRDYLQSVEWRSEALAQSIVNDVADLFAYITYQRAMLTGLDGLVRRLYDANHAKDVTYIAFVDNAGVFAAHSDRALRDTPVARPVLAQALAAHQQVTVLDANVYHTLVPVFGTQANLYLGAALVGFPKAAFDDKTRAIMVNAAMLFGVFMLLAVLAFSTLLNVMLTQPVRRLVQAGQALASGDLTQTFAPGRRRDEVAVVGAVFNRIGDYLQHVAAVAAQISVGMLDGDIRVRSQDDVLGKAVHDMLRYLNYVESIARRIAAGDLRENIVVRSEHDAFGRSIQGMLEGLRTLIVQIRTSADRIDATQRAIAALAAHDIGIVRDVHAASETAMTTLRVTGASVEEVAQSMDALSASTTETSAAVTQMAASISHIAGHTTDLAQQTQATIAYLERTVGSLGEIVAQTDVSRHLSHDTRQDALKGREAMEQVAGSMATIQTAMLTAVEAMTQFADRSQDIDHILEVIREITEQTGLLALNASIIAAQAGVHGRGFAVVADEIRNLATGVGASTTEISAIVTALQHDTQRVMRSVHAGAAEVRQGMERTQQARETLHNILASAERSSEVVTGIAQTLHDLMAASQELSASMARVNAMTDDITAAITQHDASTRQITTAIAHLNHMAAQNQSATTQQRDGIRQVIQVMQTVAALIDSNLESSQKITDTTRELASQSDFLVASVARFEVADR